MMKRFNFWKVLLVVLGGNTFLFMLSVISISIMPKTAGEVVTLKTYIGWDNLLKQVVYLIFISIFFYATLNYFYRFLLEKKRFIYYVGASLAGAVWLNIYNTIVFIYFPAQSNMGGNVTPALITFKFTLSTLLYTGMAILIAYLISLKDEKKQRKILEEQKMQLEYEKSQANFNFLKAQINPHFLHNTLNFLYAKSLPYSEELSEGILTLSDIMRYALSEGSMKDGKVLLTDEIAHVRNVIKINQLRFSNNLKVNMEVNALTNGATIIPFILITLVENAFKHGDLRSQDHPIEIKLDVNKERLYFYCSNKKKSGPKEISTGIGLDNIRKRLELAYHENFRLQIKDDECSYTTELTISQL